MYDKGYADGKESARKNQPLSFTKRNLDYNLGFITGWEDYHSPIDNIL